MQIVDKSYGAIVDYLEKGDDTSLNIFLGLILNPNEDTTRSYAEEIKKIKELKVRDIKSIADIISPKSMADINPESIAAIISPKPSNKSYAKRAKKEKGGKYEYEREQENEEKSIVDIWKIEDEIARITSYSFLSETELNIYASHLDYSLIDNYSSMLPKKIYFHKLRIARLKVYTYKLISSQFGVVN